MKRINRRMAATVAALAAVGLVASACGDDSPSVEDVVGSATSAVQSAAESVASEAQGADETTGAEATGAEATGAETTGAEATGAEGDEPAGDQTSAVPGPGGEPVELSGQILEKYNEVGGESSPLGMATGNQEEVGDGSVAEFDGGIIAWSPDTDAHIVWGEIRVAWEAEGGAGGELGFPVSDEYAIENGLQSDFANGSITYIDGMTEVMMG